MSKEHTIGKYCYAFDWGDWEGNFNTIKEAVDAARIEAKDHYGPTPETVDIGQWAKREINPEELGDDVANILNGMGCCEYGDKESALITRWMHGEEINKDFTRWVTQWLKNHNLWNKEPMVKDYIRIQLKNYNLTGNFEQKLMRGLVEDNALYKAYLKEFGGKKK